MLLLNPDVATSVSKSIVSDSNLGQRLWVVEISLSCWFNNVVRRRVSLISVYIRVQVMLLVSPNFALIISQLIIASNSVSHLGE